MLVLKNMDIEKFIENYDEEDLLKVMFDWNGKHADKFVDKNMLFREQVLEVFKKEKSIFSLELIAALYEAETEFARQAWGVNPVVSELAQTLLEKGRTKYVVEYLKGLYRGMDAFIQARQIELSENCLNELLVYCKQRSENDSFPNTEQISVLTEFVEYKLAEKH